MHDVFVSPLSRRYASRELSFIFSDTFKYVTWRKLWIALATAQKSLGLPITDAQIQELHAQLNQIDYAKVATYEKQFRHDVMAHIHAYGDLCPQAKGIIHWGATSCYVTDNTDLIQMHEALKIVRGKLLHAIENLAHFAKNNASLACLSYTHLQPAQPTTMGKRACLWLQDFLIDLQDISALLEDFRFLGTKGATGTQASFLHLFNGDHKKVQ